jgi:hypothetical protein
MREIYMKNKLFLTGIMILLIFAIIGMSCDGGGSLGGGGSGGGSLGGGGSGGGSLGGSGGSGGGSGGSGGGKGGDLNGGNGGSGSSSDGSGSGGGYDDDYDSSGGSGGSGSGDRYYDDNRGGSGIIIFGGSGRSKSYHTVKFTVTSSDESGNPVNGTHVKIHFSYPSDNFSWTTGYSEPITNDITEPLPWGGSVRILDKVIGGGIILSAESDNNRSLWLTAKIFIDGKEKSIGKGQGEVTVSYF